MAKKFPFVNAPTASINFQILTALAVRSEKSPAGRLFCRARRGFLFYFFSSFLRVPSGYWI